MKAIAINGSPRKGGNTETLLRKVLEQLTKAGWHTEFIQLGGQGNPWVPGLLPVLQEEELPLRTERLGGL
jgi:NAD(P)H-dependent FMN reductase